MIDRLNEVMGSKAPSMTFMPESQIRQLYEEHLVSDEMFEVAFKEVIKFLGWTTGFEVGKVKIKKKHLYQAYSPLYLKKKVLQQVLIAHDKVLTYGEKTGKEYAVAINKETGEIITEKAGENGIVEWTYPRTFKGEIIAVHNHLASTPPSPTDLFSFGLHTPVKVSVVQCHNGDIHILEKKKKNIIFEHTEETLETILSNIRKNAKHKHLSKYSTGVIFIDLISNQMSWDYRKVVNYNV